MTTTFQNENLCLQAREQSMSKKAKTTTGAVVTKKSRFDRFFERELPHLKEEQEMREAQVKRGRRLLDSFRWEPAENNVARFILEKLDGFGEFGKHDDVLIVTFKEVLSGSHGGSGVFYDWYRKWTADITYEASDGTLWCEEDDWIVFMALARFLTLTEFVEKKARELFRALKDLGRESESSSQGIDLCRLVCEFLCTLDADPFLKRFNPE